VEFAVSPQVGQASTACPTCEGVRRERYLLVSSIPVGPKPAYSGSGTPLVSGANGSGASPSRNTRHMVTPA